MTDTFSTTGYYFDLMRQAEMEQGIFESMVQYDFKLASLGPVNESNISEEDSQYLREASENIFKKIWERIVTIAKAIGKFFKSIGTFVKNLFTKNKAKEAIVNSQIKEAELVAKTGKVIIDEEIVNDAINNIKDNGDEEEIVAKISNIANVSNNQKPIPDTIFAIGKSTSFTTDIGTKKKGVALDQEVAKVIVNHSQYDEPCGPMVETVKMKKINDAALSTISISGINCGHDDDQRLHSLYKDIKNLFNSNDAADAKDIANSILERYDDIKGVGGEYKVLSNNPLTAYRIGAALALIQYGKDEEQILNKAGLNEFFKSLAMGNEEIEITQNDFNRNLKNINNWLETAIKKQDSGTRLAEKIEKMKESSINKLMTEYGVTTEVFSAISSFLQSGMHFDKVFVVPYINAVQARHKYMTDVVAKKFTSGVIITPKVKNEED